MGKKGKGLRRVVEEGPSKTDEEKAIKEAQEAEFRHNLAVSTGKLM